MQLTPFSFQENLKSYFKNQNRIWDFFSSFKVQDDEYDHFKTEILKNCYRLSKDLHPNYHNLITEIKQSFSLEIEVLLYQEQNNTATNASVFFINNEAHIVLTGSILEKLQLEEIKVILAHELSHVLLYTINEGEFQTTERIINAITDDMRSPVAYFETARLYSLYTELFCDYGSYVACQDRDLIISTLVKVHTGLDQVYAGEYLEQINEIFSKENFRSEQSSHPEMYFRAKSLELLCKNYEEGKTEIEPYISGNPPLVELDIFKQKKWQNLSLLWIQFILSALFMQSAITKNHAKSYFPNFANKVLNEEEKEKLKNEIDESAKSIKDYLCYILFDFTLVDREIYEVALIWNLQISEHFSLKIDFEKIVKKELDLSELRFKDLYKKCMIDYQNLGDNQLIELETKSSYNFKNREER